MSKCQRSKSHHVQTYTFLYFPPDVAKDPRYVSVHYATLPRKPPAGLNDIKLVSRLSFCNDLVSIFKVLHLSVTPRKYLPGLHFCWDGTNQSKFKLQYTLPWNFHERSEHSSANTPIDGFCHDWNAGVNMYCILCYIIGTVGLNWYKTNSHNIQMINDKCTYMIICI